MNRITTVRQAAERWAKDLTDVSGRNRLLFYRDLKVGTLNLTDADPGELARLLSSVPGKQIRLRRLFSRPDSTHQDLTDDAVKRARAISRKALENFEERGISTLFIVRGMATWTTEASSAKPAAPVLMCPLGLHRRGASEADFDLSLDGEWTVNGALLQSLAREFGVEASSEDLLGSYLADARLDDDEVAAIFDDLSNRASRIPNFAIQRQRMLIGNFMYKKLPMVNGLRNNLEVLAQNDLVAAIAGDEDAGNRLRRHHTHGIDLSRPDSIPPADEFLVLDADSSQNAAITFFDGSGNDDEDDEDEGSLAVFESILDVMDSLLSRRPITWHYRSQDERLIAFSNHNIYHGALTTFPGASAATCVNFDQESSPALEAFFDEMAEERAFIKNLERVQGDERDAIILSVGYGKNSDGRLMYRFGPLNAEGGERRLNVAVTRARRRMTVVSSFSHTEMDPNRSSALGVQHLRGFLRYAESGGADLSGTDGTTFPGMALRAPLPDARIRLRSLLGHCRRAVGPHSPASPRICRYMDDDRGIAARLSAHSIAALGSGPPRVRVKTRR